MVICTYFLNNSCRFGSKCNNDHIDLASVIKSEVDVTLKGNQWPLSCFGPFKERPCIPNFIEDVSFEEIRMMYLEAKMQNNIPAHQMQLMQMINEAKQKMQWLSTSTREVMNVLIEIYNQQEDSSKQPNAGAATAVANPFAAVTSTSGTAASIFGGGNTGGFGASGGTGFGGAGGGTAGNIFAAVPNQSAANIFGGGGTTSGSIGGNIFGKPAQTTAPTGNVFGLPALGGQQQQQQQATSVFGGPPVFGGGTGASLFSSVGQTTAATSGSIFGNAQSTNTTGNLFAQQPAATQSVFGQPTQSQNIFAAAPQTQSPFGAAPVPAAPASTNLFTSTTFGTPSSAVAAPTQQNLFTSAGFAGQPAAASPFGQPQTSQQPSQSLFLQAVAPAAVTQSPFGGTTTAFGAVPTQSTAVAAVTVAASATLYSRMEDLTKDQLDAFNADRFELGKIPTVPPPRELCS